jgi:peptide/nickel transport system substrate-binding protein
MLYEKVEGPPTVFRVYDLNLRAMTPAVKGFAQPQAWLVDLTLLCLEE